jgi:hypothetical protein
MLGGQQMKLKAPAIRFAPFLCLAFLLCACAEPVEPPPAQVGGTATIAPSSGQLSGAIDLSAIHLEQHDASPGLCNAAVYGSIAAAAGVGLCVCQPQDDGMHGDWVQVISRQRCWADGT